MYKKILIPLENTETDKIILPHALELVKLCKSQVLLVHVADGFVARNQDRLNLADSEEMVLDREYLKSRESEFISMGIQTASVLAKGEPAKEILAIAEKENCDLIAMATHGHRWLGDLIFGSVAENIRHRTGIPILMVKA